MLHDVITQMVKSAQSLLRGFNFFLHFTAENMHIKSTLLRALQLLFATHTFSFKIKKTLTNLVLERR